MWAVWAGQDGDSYWKRREGLIFDSAFAVYTCRYRVDWRMQPPDFLTHLYTHSFIRVKVFADVWTFSTLDCVFTFLQPQANSWLFSSVRCFTPTSFQVLVLQAHSEWDDKKWFSTMGSDTQPHSWPWTPPPLERVEAPTSCRCESLGEHAWRYSPLPNDAFMTPPRQVSLPSLHLTSDIWRHTPNSFFNPPENWTSSDSHVSLSGFQLL